MSNSFRDLNARLKWKHFIFGASGSLQILSSGEHQQHVLKNPRLCNPIKVTGFISPDLTFSAPEDFMTLPMPSFYYLAAIMNVMHNIFFFRWFFKSWVSLRFVTRIGKFLDFMKYWFCSCIQVGVESQFRFLKDFIVFRNSLKSLIFQRSRRELN